MVLFMAGLDDNAHPFVSAEVVRKRLRLHIQAVIVMADPNPDMECGAVSEYDYRNRHTDRQGSVTDGKGNVLPHAYDWRAPV